MSLSPEGSPVLHGAGVLDEEANGVATERKREGALDRTMTVDVVDDDVGTEMGNMGMNKKDSVPVELSEDRNLNGAEDPEHIDDAEDSGASQKVMEYLHDAREDAVADSAGPMFQRLKKIQTNNSDAEPADDTPDATAQLSTPMLSPIADDSPSFHDSVISSPTDSLHGTHHSSPFHTLSPALRPFDRRFQSRLRPQTPPPISAAFLKTSSRSSSTLGFQDEQNINADGAPWDVIRWTKLKKLTAQVFSETGRRNFGTPTCISVSATIVLGTSKGIILVFDYVQSLKNIIGPGTKAVECGSITALAVSADHTTIAGGHSQGHIFTWELAKPSRPFLSIPPVSSSILEQRKSDGHVEGVSVLHLGFLGTRHTALVSADGKGMAFSHLATRGFGALVRIVKTTRILGRYPFDVPASGRPRKPSSVLAFAPLPLGNSIQATDSMGLVAILAPHLLVIISTTPIAQTHHKAGRPKEVANDKALSGCLAWFPAVKLKESTSASTLETKPSKAKLAYSWSNVLTILELSIVDPEPSEDPNRPPVLQFRAKSRWECDEAIVAVQWISRQILGVLTSTQRLIILEEPGLRMTETFDLVPKQIIHHRHFRHQLMPLIDALDEEASFHSAIADAFYNSFKTYKGRIFLLCQYEVSVGALSNWADRLLAMMEVGDFIGAIRLATSYFMGEADKITVGLPEEAHLRQSLVQEKLLEMMAASLRYAFGRTTSAARSEILGKDRLQELASVCFVSCLCMDTTDFLFDEVFEFYESGGYEGIFLETLDPYILESRITSIPPTIIKALITHFTSLDQEGKLEEMICHMNTTTMDIDQVTTLCKKHNLYDALIYVWNRALGDYITPIIELLSLLRPLVYESQPQNDDSIHSVNASKVFPYLSYTLTGRIYPTGELLSEAEANSAKAAIYYFLFLGRTITWPRQGGTPFLTRSDGTPEQSFPYLRLILHYDAPSFLSALNEAFEDAFLNGPIDQTTTTDIKGESTEEQMFARSVNRQYIITILQEVMNNKEFPLQDVVYLNMFIARNLPKFQQFILLTGTSLNSVLVGLCNYPGMDIADDCQLSVEYLLSVYHPPDADAMIHLFEKAKFYRVLKSIFRAEKQYEKLLEAYFKDEDSLEAVFGCIEECLQPQSQVSARQRHEVRKVIVDNSRKLIDIDGSRAAKYISAYAPDLHSTLLDTIQDKPQDQFSYLRAILEPPTDKEGADAKRPEILSSAPFLVELYVRLMCKYDPQNLQGFVGRLEYGDLRLEEVLPSMEESGVVDATVTLMAREGRLKDAMDRLVKHLHSLEAALLGIIQELVQSISGSERNDMEGSTEDLLVTLKKYTQVGIWLCQYQIQPKTSTLNKGKNLTNTNSRDALSLEELLWLDFIDTIVQIAKNCTSALKPSTSPENTVEDKFETNSAFTTSTITAGATPSNTAATILYLRKLVQDTFTALLTSTTTAASQSNITDMSSVSTNTSFLRILRAFLSRASISSPSLSELRSVLASIFDAYTYENQLLSLANKLLDKDRFEQVDEAVDRRRRGWRPLGQACEACGRRAWGPGAAGGIFAAWEKRKVEEYRKLREERGKKGNMNGVLNASVGMTQVGNGGGSGNSKGKGKMQQSLSAITATATAAAVVNSSTTSTAAAKSTTIEASDVNKLQKLQKQEASDLVIFTCRHIYHKSCLEKLQGNEDPRSNPQSLLQQRPAGAWLTREFRCVTCESSEERDILI